MTKEHQFVREIEKRECLYNYNLADYNCKEVVDQAWADVGRKTGLSVAECKEKWRNMRSSYLRSLKKSNKPKKPYYLSPYLKFVLPYLKPLATEFLDESQKESDVQMSDENESKIIDIHSLKAEREEIETQFVTVDIEAEKDVLSDKDSDRSSPVSDSLETVSPRVKRRRQTIVSRHNRESRNITKRRKTTQSNTHFPPSLTSQLNNTSMRYFLLSLLPDFETMTNDQIRLFKTKVLMLIDDIKTNFTAVKQSSFSETEQQQKRLTNLLIKNLREMRKK